VDLPDGVTATNVRPGPPGFATVDLDVDVEAFVGGVRAALASTEEGTFERRAETYRAFDALVREAANDEARVSGLEARFWVRGSLGHLVGEDVGALARDLLRDPGCVDPGGSLHLLTVGNRARIAAAALRGHVEHVEGERPDCLAWYRLLGSTAVSVGRADG